MSDRSEVSGIGMSGVGPNDRGLGHECLRITDTDTDHRYGTGTGTNTGTDTITNL